MAIGDDKTEEVNFNLAKVLIVLLASMQLFFVGGGYFGFACYIEDLKEVLNTDYTGVVSAGIVNIFISYAFSTFYQQFIERTSYYITMLLAGFLIFFSYFVSSYVTTLFAFYLTWTITFGVASGLIWTLSFSVLIDFMDNLNELAIAKAVSNAAMGLGIITISCFISYYLDVHQILSFGELFRYLSIIGLIIMCQTIATFEYMNVKLINDVKPQIDSRIMNESSNLIATHDNFNLSSSLDGTNDHKSQLSGWELMLSGDQTSITLFISTLLTFTTALVPARFSILYATSHDSNIYLYYYVPIAFGTGFTISRFCFNWLVSCGVPPNTVNKIILFGQLLNNIQLTFTPEDNTTLILFALCFSGVFNVFLNLLSLRCIQIFGTDPIRTKFNTALLLFAAGLGQTIGGILGGVIYDNSDSFYWLFLSCVIVTAIAIIFDEIFFPEFVYFVFPRSKQSVSTSL